MTDDLSSARQRREQRRSTTPVGAFGVSSAKQARISRVTDKVHRAERRHGPPTPERITIALDICDLYGPEVDEALGGEEPMVDEWETGERIPTSEQMRASRAGHRLPPRLLLHASTRTLAGRVALRRRGLRAPEPGNRLTGGAADAHPHE